MSSDMHGVENLKTTKQLKDLSEVVSCCVVLVLVDVSKYFSFTFGIMKFCVLLNIVKINVLVHVNRLFSLTMHYILEGC